MRYPRQDQVLGRGDAGDGGAVRDMRRDQAGRQRAHPDLIAAIADRDSAPGAGSEDLIQGGGVGANVLVGGSTKQIAFAIILENGGYGGGIPASLAPEVVAIARQSGWIGE